MLFCCMNKQYMEADTKTEKSLFERNEQYNDNRHGCFTV